jgi:hypothetical protein
MPVAADANNPAKLEDMQRLKGIRNTSLYFFIVLYYHLFILAYPERYSKISFNG